MVMQCDCRRCLQRLPDPVRYLSFLLWSIYMGMRFTAFKKFALASAFSAAMCASMCNITAYATLTKPGYSGNPGYTGGPGSLAAEDQWSLGQDGEYRYIRDGQYVVSDWVNDPADGKWYYLGADSKMQKSWVSIDGKWYYFSPDSGEMLTGWRNINDQFYYFAEAADEAHPLGSCYINEQTPDHCYVDENGVRVSALTLAQLSANHPNPYGTTCVEVDITNQVVYVYQGMEMVIATACVTGYNNVHSTPTGSYHIQSKEQNRTLRGTNDNGTKYASHVDYWMPFNGGYGLHDASWRSEFGGNIYTYNGSHGCVNLPHDAAQQLYSIAYVGMPVYIHK